MIGTDRLPRRRALAGLVTLAAAVGGLLAQRAGLWSVGTLRRGDGVAVAAGRSPYLRGLVEPIAIVRGKFAAGSDDHWLAVAFRDGRGIERSARYVYYWPPVEASGREIRHLLYLGGWVPFGGVEEHAFLGVLERWYAADPEARDLWDRARLSDPALGATPWGYAGLTEAQAGKITAVAILRVLRGAMN